jgi:hypothetical protein
MKNEVNGANPIFGQQKSPVCKHIQQTELVGDSQKVSCYPSAARLQL